MTRVLHTGDTHIGYQQYNAPERRRDFLRAFRQVAEDAVADDVDAVVHAGDLFHDRRPGLVDLQGTVEVLRTLADADVSFLAVVGNHEGKRDAQWLDLFADLGLATRLGPAPVAIGDVAFYGLDFVPRSRRDDLAYDFESPPPGADHAALVSHGLFEPFPHGDWDTERLLEESSVEFDAVLLGDDHHPDTAEVRDTWVTYCGSTERASASEREERGYNLVRFDGEVAIARRGLDATREFVFVDVELNEGEGTERVRERVRERDLADAVVVVTVEGEGEPITPASIEEFALERDALIARVNDRRDVATEEEVSVRFADPDEAVRERVRDLGLSDAAREIDRTVRDADLADSNVRESVERRVRELLEEDDGAPFRPTPDAAVASDSSETGDDPDGDDREVGDRGVVADGADEDTDDADSNGGTDDSDPDADTDDSDPDADTGDGDPDTDTDDGDSADRDDGREDASGAETTADRPDAGETSLGDFA